jgi:hypothetical protein
VEVPERLVPVCDLLRQRADLPADGVLLVEMDSPELVEFADLRVDSTKSWSTPSSSKVTVLSLRSRSRRFFSLATNRFLAFRVP